MSSLKAEFSSLASHRSWYVDIIILTVLGVIFFSLFLGSYPLLVPDEGRYAEVAREMFSHHNYITPMLNTVVFFDKPPLYYWLSAAAMHIAGVNEWTARIAPALFGLLGILGIYITGRLLDNRRTGLIAAGILATTPLYFLSAHYANCDLIVAVCISLSLWSTLIAFMRPDLKYRSLCMFSAYVWCALAILAKGLIGIVFPVAIIGAFILIFNRWSLIKSMHLLLGLLLIVLMVVPWFIAVSHANAGFLHYFFYIQHYQRFISKSFNDHQPFWFYIPVVIFGSFPWIFYFVQAIKRNFSKLTVPLDFHINGFLLIWIAIVFIFFSLPASKIVGYILPIIPPIALLLARYIDKSWDELHRFPLLISLLTLLVIGILLLIIPHIVHIHVAMTTTVYAGLDLLVLVALGFYAYHRIRKPYFIIVGVNALFLLTAISFGHLAVPSTTKGLALWLNKNQIPSSQVFVYRSYAFDLPFYLQGPIHVVVENWQDPQLMRKDNWKGEFAYNLRLMQEPNAYFVNQSDFVKQWTSGQPMYVLIPSKHIAELQTDVSASSPLKPVFISQQWSLVSNVTQH